MRGNAEPAPVQRRCSMGMASTNARSATVAAGFGLLRLMEWCLQLFGTVVWGRLECNAQIYLFASLIVPSLVPYVLHQVVLAVVGSVGLGRCAGVCLQRVVGSLRLGENAAMYTHTTGSVST